jgi:hypothetical protein
MMGQLLVFPYPRGQDISLICYSWSIVSMSELELQSIRLFRPVVYIFSLTISIFHLIVCNNTCSRTSTRTPLLFSHLSNTAPITSRFYFVHVFNDKVLK